MNQGTLYLNDDCTHWIFIDREGVVKMFNEDINNIVEKLENENWSYQWTHANGSTHYFNKAQ